ncbi:MAG: NUDIX hydrolase, partial [Defluviitaleaceae bacterium]|nr:NUDIX hydrolase [Defluviitaleaceae bacterium]
NVRLPDVRTAKYDVIVHCGAAAIIPVRPDKKIILVRQYREAVGREILEIPAGRLEKGEDPAECARRELKEETGCAAADMDFLTKFYPVVGYSTEIIHFYVAQNLSSGEPDPDENEFVRAEAYSLAEALKMIDSGEIMDGKTIAALLLYERQINKPAALSE